MKNGSDLVKKMLRPAFVATLPVLPYAVMGMLVVYCLKGVSVSAVSGWLPSLAACGVTGLLYVWKRNTLLSIVAGTLCYMLLVQQIF